MATVKALKNAVVYINTITCLGVAKTVTLPVIEKTTADHETLGMPGTKRIGVGFEAMEATISWEGWTAQIAKYAYNTEALVDLQIRAEIEDTSGVVTTRASCIVYLKGNFRSTQGGDYSAKALATRESTLDIQYFKEEINGESIVEIDVVNNTHKVGGVDLNADRNRILGIV